MPYLKGMFWRAEVTVADNISAVCVVKTNSRVTPEQISSLLLGKVPVESEVGRFSGDCNSPSSGASKFSSCMATSALWGSSMMLGYSCGKVVEFVFAVGRPVAGEFTAVTSLLREQSGPVRVREAQ